MVKRFKLNCFLLTFMTSLGGCNVDTAELGSIISSNEDGASNNTSSARTVVPPKQNTSAASARAEQAVIDVPAIDSFKLIGFTAERDMIELQTLEDGDVIDISQTSTNLLNIEALSENALSTGSVHFTLQGPTSIDRWENDAIYTMAVEGTDLNIENGELPVGEYVLSATPFESGNMGGAAGDTHTISFTVVDVPTIESFKLIGFTDDRDMIEVQALKNGDVIDLSQAPTNLLNIEALSTNALATGSVHFQLKGPKSIDRWENHAIYTMAVEGTNLDLENDGLPAGDYVLSATPFSSEDMTGGKGITSTVSFSVIDGTVPESNVPKLLAAEFMAFTDETDDPVSLDRITEGYTFDLSKSPSARVNVVAISEDEDNTGSVHFSLTGPAEFERAENDAKYTMAPEPAQLDLAAKELPAGDYTLIVTPYAEADANGEAGIPLLVNFSVKGKYTATASEPPATDPEAPVAGTPDDSDSVTLVTADDHYTFSTGSSHQPGMDLAVSSNDSYSSEDAYFEVTQGPLHGEVEMFELGLFTYVAAPDFSGTDSFTYQVSAAGKTSSAEVQITVMDDASGKGFTAITPSADSKLIYVSNSSGKDSNDCLSEAKPCKSLDAAFEKMRSGKPDHVYLKRGDTWRNQGISEVSSGRSTTEPAVVTSYGSGPRPVLETDGRAGVFNDGTLAHVAFIGLHVYTYKHDTENAEFTGKSTDSSSIGFLGAHTDILFEDNIFDHIEVKVQDWEGSGGRPSNFRFRRNIFTGKYFNESSDHRDSRPSNMFIKGIDGLILEENVFDYGGWNPEVKGAGANMYNHNVYLQHGSDGNQVHVRGNIITRGSSHGIQMRSGGIADNNFFGRNAISLLIGYSVKPLETGVMACGINNVVTEGHSMVKGLGACAGKNLCTPAAWGIDFDTHGDANWQSYGNVVHSLAKDDDQWIGRWNKLNRVSYRMDTSVVKNADNHSWHWKSDSEGDDKKYADPSRTLGDYYENLKQNGVVKQDAAGEDNFDKFMTMVKTRAPGEWPEALSADAINDFIRAGYGVAGNAKCK